MIQTVRQYAAYLALRIIVCVLQALSLEQCAEIARALAPLGARRLRRRLTDNNLRHAFPELSAAERSTMMVRMWEHLFLLVAEIAHARRKIHETNWRQYIRVENAREFIGALLDDRPTLLVSAHFGNFELAGFAIGLLGFPTFTVARTLDNPFVDSYVNRFRAATGQHIVPKKGGYDQILNVLGSGGTMTFLADQYAGSKGCWIEFFGRPASAHKAIALLALDNDAPLFVGYAVRVGQPLHYELGLRDAIDPRQLAPAQANVRHITQRFTSDIEWIVRRAPEQYWWLHDRWKDRRAKERAQRRAHAA